jgi:hypothetical protein
MFDPRAEPDPDCLLCKRANELGIWERYGCSDPFGPAADVADDVTPDAPAADVLPVCPELHQLAAFGPDDEHDDVTEDWRTGHPLYGRTGLAEICQRLDVADRYVTPLRAWWLGYRRLGLMTRHLPTDLVDLLDGFAGYSPDTPEAPAGSAWRVLCADDVCRHSDPFPTVPEADAYAVAEHPDCPGGRHSIVGELDGLAVATTEGVR